MLIFPVIFPMCKAFVDNGMELGHCAGPHDEMMTRMIQVEQRFTLDEVLKRVEYGKRCMVEGNFIESTVFNLIQIQTVSPEPILRGKAARKAKRKAKLG